MSCMKKPILLFETIRVIDFVAQNLDFHILRMQRAINFNKNKFTIPNFKKMSKIDAKIRENQQIFRPNFYDFTAKNLDFKTEQNSNQISTVLMQNRLKFNLRDVLKPPRNGLLAAKLIYTEFGEFVRVEYKDYVPKIPRSFALVRQNGRYERKYLERGWIDAVFAMRGVCDDAIIVQNNLVRDSTRANVAVFYEDLWLTPAHPLLAGTTRERYLKMGLLREFDITTQMLKSARKIAVMNAMIDFVEIKNAVICD